MNLFRRAWISASFPRVPGLFIPIEEASRSYLSAELDRRGFPPSMVPAACIREIVRERIKIAHLMMKHTTPRDVYGSRQDIRQIMALSLDDDADQIAEVLTGTTDPWHDSLRARAREELARTLAKHGVAVPKDLVSD